MVVARSVFVTRPVADVLVTVCGGGDTRISARNEFSLTACGDRMSALCDSLFIDNSKMERSIAPATLFLAKSRPNLANAAYCRRHRQDRAGTSAMITNPNAPSAATRATSHGPSINPKLPPPATNALANEPA